MAAPAVPGLELLEHAKREQPVLVHEVNPQAHEHSTMLHTMWHSGPTLVKRFVLVVVIDADIHNTRPLLVDQSFGQGLTGGMPGEEHNPLSLSKRCAAQLPVPMPLPEIVE